MAGTRKSRSKLGLEWFSRVASGRPTKRLEGRIRKMDSSRAKRTRR